MSKNIGARLQPFDPSIGLPDKRVPILDVVKQVAKRTGHTINKANDKSYKDILKFAWVSASKIYINYTRQRWPEVKHIDKLLNKWNINCVTPLQCRYDPKTDRYYACDGQQHMIAWTIKYGLNNEVPVFFVESEDENVESIQLLALNCDNEPMAKYFILEQRCMMGDPEALALRKAVQDADCELAYKKRAPGCITNIRQLLDAHESYGNAAITLVLAKLRQYWPEDKIETPTMLGFLKVRDLMIKSESIQDSKFASVFNDVFYACQQRFQTSKDVHHDIHSQFIVTYPTNYKGMGAREQVASGIISVYEKSIGKPFVTKPFEIDIPVMVSNQLVEEEEEDNE